MLYYNEIYLTDNSPSPGKAGYTNGVYVLYSFRTVVFFFFFLRPQFSSLSLKSRKSNFFADVFTKAALSSQLLKDPECWSSRGLNPC